MTKRMYEITTYKPGHRAGDVGSTSGPFETRTSAERALTALFQSGQACDGRVYEVEVESDDTEAGAT